MELTAVLESLKALQKNDTSNNIIYYIDSEYVVKGINLWSNNWNRNGWKTKTGKVKNLEIWKEILELKKQFKDITFNWVRGHDDNEMNERCDQIARENINISK
jgi:ribonuclease HI